MDNIHVKIACGGLLHDIGKIIDSKEDNSGLSFLVHNAEINDEEILEQIKYNTDDKATEAKNESLAFVTNFASAIATAANRRKENRISFVGNSNIESIFNILNGNNEKKYFLPQALDINEEINYPIDKKENSDLDFYKRSKAEIELKLKELRYETNYVNSLLNVLERNLAFVPASVENDINDISLYDHSKLTAMLALCIYDFLKEKKVECYKEELCDASKRETLLSEKMFLLVSLDVSGVQDFIYSQFGTSDVLKNLRSRSFYLDIILENMADNILDSIGLARTNLIYTGGGHAYLLLPNTQYSRVKLDEFEKISRDWFLEKFEADLYVAIGYTACSAKELENEPEGSYSKIFQNETREISKKKLNRYNMEELMGLNNKKLKNNYRECKVCHRSYVLNDDNLCPICSSFVSLSSKIVSEDYPFYVVSGKKRNDNDMEVFRNQYLSPEDEREGIINATEKNPDLLRVYVKNEPRASYPGAIKLFVADYCSDYTLERLAASGEGIEKLGVLRADVDNLGKAFVSGFPKKYQTISRASSFSRMMSTFFKLYINRILLNPVFSLKGKRPQKKRNAAVIYAGGDDMFVVGAWKDIIEFSVDINNDLKRFAQKTLSVSGGIGIYDSKYPISYMAQETADLEDASKKMDGKDSITLFSENHSFKWDDFIYSVYDKKFKLIYDFFEENAKIRKNNDENVESRGKNYLYNILELVRNCERSEEGDDEEEKKSNKMKYGGKLNIAKLAYMLSRLAPEKKAPAEYKDLYDEFSRKLYEWSSNSNDRREIIMAIYIYAYLQRKQGK